LHAAQALRDMRAPYFVPGNGTLSDAGRAALAALQARDGHVPSFLAWHSTVWDGVRGEGRRELQRALGGVLRSAGLVHDGEEGTDLARACDAEVEAPS
jgi:hypothetical protein